MVNEPKSSDLVDPLDNHSGLTLFPRTFRVSTNVPTPNDPDDIESIHNYMKSMALRSPSKLLEQAKVIIDGGSELLNSSSAHFAAFESKDEAIAAKGKENPQERRPALGRKRARFSLKPNLNQPSVSLEPSLDIAQLQDPEEYFLAHERLENAKKELQRQKVGVVTHVNEYNPSKTARRRRPGLLGKSASYKHHQYASALSENNNTFMSSQETLELDILSPRYGLPPETTDPNFELQEKELAGSIDKTKNRVNELFDELLSSNCENLDGDGTLSFLQESLQIKPIDLDKLCLPDLHDITRNDFMVSKEKLLGPRNTLSDIQNMVKGRSGKTPVKHKQVAESPINLLDSATPPKSPFAAISILKKRILQSNMSSDPFSAVIVDLSPSKNPSSVECTAKQSDQVDLSKEMRVSEKLKSIFIEKDNNIVANTGTPASIRRDSFHHFETFTKDKSSGRSVGIDVRSSGSHGDLEHNNESSNIDERQLDDDVSRPNEMDIQRTGPNEMEDHVEDMLDKAVSSAQPLINIKDSIGHADADSQTYVPIEMEENAGDMRQEALSPAVPDINTEDPTIENLKSSQSQLDQSSPAAVEHHATNDPSRAPDIAPEQHNEDPSRISFNKRSKATKPPREIRKRKPLSRRQSLAAAGTFWESGVRRSSRIKMRPLEYWKGERFLYGRIHESLTSVIGVKYASPVKGNEKPTIKVKSYVPDKYKELVELAALH
ncbi:centromere protein C isoform X2 [Cornus florida]|uniref:centromere protein C isoform X2 n=1 Tax=Cornus florida TaxID=4283 RepID=UPI00289B4B98|nr:centromere protein C isoform X2 [Cornus florida]